MIALFPVVFTSLDSDPAPAHRRAGDRRRAGERAVGPDRIRHSRSWSLHYLAAPLGVAALALGLVALSTCDRLESRMLWLYGQRKREQSYFVCALSLERVERFERLARRHLVGIERRERLARARPASLSLRARAGALRRTAAGRRSACAPATCGPRLELRQHQLGALDHGWPAGPASLATWMP